MKSSRSSTWLVRCMAARSLIAMFWLVTIETRGWKELLTQAVEPLSLLKLLAGSENWKRLVGNHVEQLRWSTAYTVEISCFHSHSTHFDVTDPHQCYWILIFRKWPIELYFHVNIFFCSVNPIWPLVAWVKTLFRCLLTQLWTGLLVSQRWMRLGLLMRN